MIQADTTSLTDRKEFRTMLVKRLAVAALALLILATANPANASSRGRRNTAIGLGAVAVYELTRGHGTRGLIAGGGAVYAYKRYRDSRNDERYGWGNRDRYRGNRYFRDDNYRYRSDSDDGYYRRDTSYRRHQDNWNRRSYNRGYTETYYSRTVTRVYECGECGRDFCSRGECETHMRRAHNCRDFND